MSFLGKRLNWIEHSTNYKLFPEQCGQTDIHRRLWKCFKLWTTRPNAYDRSVGATRLFYFEDTETTVDRLRLSLQVDSEALVNVLTTLPGQLDDDEAAFNGVARKSFVVRVTFPKSLKFHVVSISVFHCDFDSNSLSCITPADPEQSYRLKFDEDELGNKVTAQIPEGVSVNARTGKLLSTFFTKATVWSKESPSPQSSMVTSVRLVGEDSYLSMYRRLKLKYGESLRQMWTECTNPEKFIYEDIAIASYLNLLWEPSTKFVDLGCGNGLLVYILTSEGHCGVGLDVRARKIWSQYPNAIDLKVKAINPSDCVFPEIDWIIGNHSDELTPWVPVIAAKSSYETQFFLLPCCSYEFSGEKYKRGDTSKSQYSDYMNYVEWICGQCGFQVVRDRLKIPSTKRLCFVSRGRVYKKDEFGTYCCKISDLVKTDSTVKIRESVEPVRNCTKLDRTLVADIVNRVATLVLEARPSSDCPVWNDGDFVDLELIARSLGPDRLSRLKNECGGLQTLLRNHRFVFRVEGGRVKLRQPRVLTTRPTSWKVAPCWFYRNHPQSCPLNDCECSYVH